MVFKRKQYVRAQPSSSIETKPDGRVSWLRDEARARWSSGESGEAVYKMVGRVLSAVPSVRGGTLIDVGCGRGALWLFVHTLFRQYVGVDLVRYGSFPEDGMFVQANLNDDRMPLPDASGEAVLSIETVEHLENPRALVRELVRLAKPGGLVGVTTPNQLSLSSKLSLSLKNQFVQFQEAPGLYPGHITALLECDLMRIATECGLCGVSIDYSNQGRIPLTGLHYPCSMTRLFPRATSDNVMMIGRKAGGSASISGASG